MSIDVQRLHHTDRATARQRIGAVAEDLSAKLGFTAQWEGDRLTFRGTGAKGYLAADDTHVHVFVKKSRLLPVSEAWIRRELDAELDLHFPTPAASSPAASSAPPPPAPAKDATPSSSKNAAPPAPTPGALLGRMTNLAGTLTNEALRLGEESLQIAQDLLDGTASKKDDANNQKDA